MNNEVKTRLLELCMKVGDTLKAYLGADAWTVGWDLERDSINPLKLTHSLDDNGRLMEHHTVRFFVELDPAMGHSADRDALVRRAEGYMRTSVFASQEPSGSRYSPYQFIVRVAPARDCGSSDAQYWASVRALSVDVEMKVAL